MAFRPRLATGLAVRVMTCMLGAGSTHPKGSSKNYLVLVVREKLLFSSERFGKEPKTRGEICSYRNFAAR